MAVQKKILFYYLSAFSKTGGIEKFNRCFIKALNELTSDSYTSSVVSVYDKKADARYNPGLKFQGFGQKRGKSLGYAVKEALRSDIFVLGHINLAIAGLLVKLLNPKCRLIVVAHGIEVWKKLPFIRRRCLVMADTILSVSTYTRNQLVLRNGIDPKKIKVFPNTIDPLFTVPQVFTKPVYLLERYQIATNSKVILTLSRLSSSEKEKGYDKVIAALPTILERVPEAVYLLAGKYDEREKERITSLANEHGVAGKVILTGFVDDTEVADHYQLADVFIMPSRKEGFGIVFLEAMACGTSVIGGNQDGTVDALRNGSLGMLINPSRIDEIVSSIIVQLETGRIGQCSLQESVLDKYQFSNFRNRLFFILNYGIRSNN